MSHPSCDQLSRIRAGGGSPWSFSARPEGPSVSAVSGVLSRDGSLGLPCAGGHLARHLRESRRVYASDVAVGSGSWRGVCDLPFADRSFDAAA